MDTKTGGLVIAGLILACVIALTMLQILSPATVAGDTTHTLQDAVKVLIGGLVGVIYQSRQGGTPVADGKDEVP